MLALMYDVESECRSTALLSAREKRSWEQIKKSLTFGLYRICADLMGLGSSCSTKEVISLSGKKDSSY